MEEKANFEPLLYTLKILKSIFKGDQTNYNRNVQKQAESIQKILIDSLNHDYSKVVASSLQAAGNFVSILRASDGSLNKKYAPLVKPLYDAIFAKLNKVDIDQEVKTRSIIAAADLVSVCNNVLTPDEIARIMQVFADRLK